ncbi:SMC domain protein [Planktothrix tepida]|uniref:SMC domain protein n=2 Tax=Planktothrix TaxID=54304 RepID=A0A1J1LDC6_9CYAN|nr:MULTISPECIES: AAA family ATPase [Planktothrix]CAD5915365.1 SMC domain protein [Planktothrix tepida]CAD5985965.1 SMC domain protein [Planktothrix pseudagardhii]CUR30605.1 SMC domain protein [Planktothrix tepida PCC 9214]
MIQEITIKNFKSIEQLKLQLGRVTLLIGENGCGKTNILEAIALSSAAASDKLDHEFLASRGIRITEPQFMRSAFNSDDLNPEIETSFQFQNDKIITYNLQHDGKPYSSWVSKISEISEEIPKLEMISTLFYQFLEKDGISPPSLSKSDYVKQQVKEHIMKNPDNLTLKKFLIFSPENSSLQIFKEEGQIQPLGIHGEGLFKLLTVLSSDKNQDKIKEIKQKMQLIDWFKDFEIPDELLLNQKNIKITDRYFLGKQKYFDQNSSNEGFLFLLFYFSLFISDNTPKFFAVDNIDVSLNPRLGRRLVQELVQLAKKSDRQVIFTTHNPGILDGLNLDDDEQRLFVIYRNRLGYTKATRISPPKPLEGQEPVRLSEAFLRGYIGGLPKNF